MSGNDELLLIASNGGSAEITQDIAGSKAAQLWRMAQLGLDVPAAFVMPTTLCAAVNAAESVALEALQRGLGNGIAWLEEVTGRRFGDSRSPLLVSVRSGAAASMPGMLSTVLNVGLNDETVHGLIRTSGNPRLAFDSYRRLVQGYAEVVDGVPKAKFEQCLNDMIGREGVADETRLDPEALERLTGEFRERAVRLAGRALPHDPHEQLRAAAAAVYRSWESPRAREYRRLNRLDDLKGTAVTVQAMVFGNSGSRSGAGVAFSRNPATGADEPYVDFLFDAQGEDVVSGQRTPASAARLEASLPQVAKRLADGIRRLEREFRDTQDVEFTVENGGAAPADIVKVIAPPQADDRFKGFTGTISVIERDKAPVLDLPKDHKKRLYFVDDHAAKSQRGHAMIVVYDTQTVTGLHHHPNAESMFVVLDGALKFTVNGEPVVVKPGQAAIFGLNDRHGLRVADGLSGASFLEFHIPSAYTTVRAT